MELCQYVTLVVFSFGLLEVLTPEKAAIDLLFACRNTQYFGYFFVLEIYTAIVQLLFTIKM